MRKINFNNNFGFIGRFRRSTTPALKGYRKRENLFGFRRSKKISFFKACPQKAGVVQKVFITTPRKPNSAKRKTAKVRLSNNRRIIVFLHGIGHNLSVHSEVIVCGGGAKDLPGVNYKCVRGKKDFGRLIKRRNGRSKYGGVKPT